MNRINISGIRDVNDPFYRYKMRKLVVIQERTKISLPNLDEVGNDIQREPEMLLEYFKRKFNSNFIKKDGRVLTTKTIKYNEFEEAIREFIEFFILCDKCNLPETTYEMTENHYILTCRCCANYHKYQPKDIKNKNASKTLEILLKNFKHFV